MPDTLRGKIRNAFAEHHARKRAARHATCGDDKRALRQLIDETTADKPVTRLEPAAAEGALSWRRTSFDFS